MKLLLSALLLVAMTACAANRQQHSKKAEIAISAISDQTSQFIMQHRRAPRDKTELYRFSKNVDVILDFSPFSSISFSYEAPTPPSFSYEIFFKIKGVEDVRTISGATIACDFK